VCNALSASQTSIPGTNFPAWMHRILRNRFISNLRKRRDTTGIADLPEGLFATGEGQSHSLELKELGKALDRLPPDQREALVRSSVAAATSGLFMLGFSPASILAIHG
jgi:RNA polymerase sigma-70 factor (ECF subfamily)